MRRQRHGKFNEAIVGGFFYERSLPWVVDAVMYTTSSYWEGVAHIGPRTSALAEYLRELVRARQTERIVDEEGEGTPFVGGKRRRHPGVCS